MHPGTGSIDLHASLRSVDLHASQVPLDMETASRLAMTMHFGGGAVNNDPNDPFVPLKLLTNSNKTSTRPAASGSPTSEQVLSSTVSSPSKGSGTRSPKNETTTAPGGPGGSGPRRIALATGLRVTDSMR